MKSLRQQIRAVALDQFEQPFPQRIPQVDDVFDADDLFEHVHAGDFGIFDDHVVGRAEGIDCRRDVGDGQFAEFGQSFGAQGEAERVEEFGEAGLFGDDDVQGQEVDQAALQFVVRAVAVGAEFAQPGRRVTGVTENPFEGRSDDDGFALVAGGGLVAVFDRGHLQPRVEGVERGFQFLGQVERFGRRDRLIERLQVLEGGVGALDHFFRAALDVVAQDGARAEERRERRDVVAHQFAQQVGRGARQLSEHEQALNRVAFVHVPFILNGYAVFTRWRSETATAYGRMRALSTV